MSPVAACRRRSALPKRLGRSDLSFPEVADDGPPDSFFDLGARGVECRFESHVRSLLRNLRIDLMSDVESSTALVNGRLPSR